jgi:porphobilinogen synthase
MYKRFRDRRVDHETRLAHREQFLNKKDFILPLFVVEGSGVKDEISSMKNVWHLSIDTVVEYLSPLVAKGLSSVLLFGVPDEKGISQAYSPEGIVQRTIPVIKQKYPQLEIITDVCLCSYTSDGHCHNGDNDETCEILSDIALSHSRAGADAVAPSDMMDGRVYHIRKKLNENGFANVPVISYSAKFASNFYGPFRDAAECAPKTGDRKTYQMDIPNGNEAIEEIKADVDEGVSQIIVKPALSYLDIISRAKASVKVPVIAYNVSGEYTMLLEMIDRGFAREEVIYEVLVSIKRAGADRIISYHTPYVLENINAFRSL